MDILEELRREHEEIRRLVHALEHEIGPQHADRTVYLRSLHDLLARHSEKEEVFLYGPVSILDSLHHHMIEDARLDHQELRDLLLELASLDHSETKFQDKLSAFRDALFCHFEDEENEIFAAVDAQHDREDRRQNDAPTLSPRNRGFEDHNL